MRDDEFYEQDDIERHYSEARQSIQKSGSNNITCVNEKRLKSLKKKIIKRIAILGGIVIMAFTGVTVYNNNKSLSPFIPEGCMETTVDEYLPRSKPVEEIAEKYYTEDTKTYYGDFDDYVKYIKQINDGKISNFNSVSEIQIPVVVEKNNALLSELSELKKQLEEMPQWVTYKVQPNDNIYSIAEKSCITAADTLETQNAIIEKNKLETTTLQIGQTLTVKNPALKEIKQRIHDLEEEFYTSITNQKVM